MKNNAVLVIDDDEVFAKTLARRLSHHQFVTDVAFDGQSALLKARQCLPNYVILDMKLATDSGLNYIKPLRQLLPKAKLVLLTGFASIATAVDAIKLGADDYLAKPVDTQTLLTTLTGEKSGTSEPVTSSTSDTLTPEQVEWEHIQQVLKANQGNVSATARQLSMHRRTLQRKLQKRPVKPAFN